MTGNRTHLFRLAASTALAATLLGGCALGGGERPSAHAAKPVAGKGAKSVARAEQVVLANPRDAAARAALGAAYLDAGRFASAVQAYDDALELGDESVPTVLGLALAETAQGNSQAALQLLSDWRDLIPAGDLGLALALAGDTSRGVAVLNEALRGGDNSPKTRQNLAFAFALNGQWTVARVMAAQDVPANQVDARLRQWASMGRPDQVRDRVAHLLGVTPVEDQGQPVALALANVPTTEQLAAEAQAQVEAPVEAAQATPVETPVAAPAAPVQLAAAELAPAAAAVAEPVAAPVVTAAPAAAPAPPILFAAPVVQPVTLASLEPSRPRVVSDAPAFASVPVKAPRAAETVAPRRVGKFVAERGKPVQPGKGKGLASLAPKPVANGTHWVQLGSYTDPAVAREGWGKFTRRTPALKGFGKVTTTATVDGTPVWRIAATGFANYDAAAKMCALVKQRGGACLVKRAEPGAASPARLARR